MTDRPHKPYDWHDYAIELEGALLEQDKRIKELQAQNAKLKKERDVILSLAKSYAFGEEPPETDKIEFDLVLKAHSLQAKRDLEQQAKGIEDFRGTKGFWDFSNCAFRRFTREHEEKLRKQAKGTN